MRMSRKLLFAGVIAAVLMFGSTFALAAIYDFEDGTDGATISTNIDGLVFQPSGGYNWVYADWRTGKYDGPYPTGPYYSEGNYFAWLGTTQNTGTIEFTNGATRFALSYSSPDFLTLEGYNATNTLVDSDTGNPNLNSGAMDILTVEAPDLAYVKIGVGSMGNYWLIDNVDTDAITGCLTPADCDDGVFCNGEEACVDRECQPGTPVDCSDDGFFCNGAEFCDEAAKSCGHQDAPVCEDDGQYCNGDEICIELDKACGHSGDPCLENETCNEEQDKCSLNGSTTDDTEEPVSDPDEGWPQGKVTGGCCGCS